MTPHFSPRPWGGTGLRDAFKKNVPTDQGPVGESWELSDHPDGRSSVLGASFGEILRAYPMAMIGRDEAPAKYPILVKYIDAAGDLSVQVHPDNEWCLQQNHDDFGKSECWYVMDCKPGTRVIYGYKPGTTDPMVRAAIAAGTLEDLLYYHPIEPGDFLTIPPGCVHAMLAGTMVCEIQQSSNTTFRIYDWNRKPARELHIEQAMQVSELDSFKLPPIQKIGTEMIGHEGRPDMKVPLLNNEFFTVSLYQLPPSCSVANADILAPTGSIVNVVAGAGGMAGDDYNQPLLPGSTFFLPAEMNRRPGLFSTSEGLRLLVTTSKEV